MAPISILSLLSGGLHRQRRQATASGLALSNVTPNTDQQITVSYSVDGQASSVGNHEKK